MQTKSSFRVVEGISGMYFYHLSKDGLNALCGARTMATGIPVESWGFKGHLNEKWCEKCEELQHL